MSLDQAHQPPQRAGAASATRSRSQVLNINKEKQEISLGMKQAQANPWDKVAEQYPPGTVVKGTVRNLTNYGAFVEIEEGIDGLLHVSDMCWTRKIGHPSEMRQEGRGGRAAVVLSVDQERQAHRPGPEADAGRPVGRPTSPAATSPGQVVDGQGHEAHQLRRLRRSWSRAWKACCTSPSCPTTRSRTPRTSSRSATRSR